MNMNRMQCMLYGNLIVCEVGGLGGWWLRVGGDTLFLFSFYVVLDIV